MKNLLYLFLIGILFSCGGSEDNETPIDNPPLDDKEHYWGFNVQDTVGLQFLGMGSCIYLDDTCTSICGVKNGKLWVGVFDSDSKNEKFTWISSNEYHLTQIKDIGYGETATIDIKNIHISYIHVQDSKTFKMLFLGNNGIVGGSSIWNLLFVHNGEETFYRDAKYYEAMTWNEECLLAINGDVSPAIYTIFDADGNKISDLSPFFFNSWKDYIFLSNKELICFRDNINGNGTYTIARVDAKENVTIWKQNIFGNTAPIFDDKISKNSKVTYTIEKIVEKEMTINMNILNYDGSQIKRKFKINTSTGEFETLGYNVIEISLDQDYIELGVGESSKLTAIILPTNATNKEIKWSSSNPFIVSIQENTFECEITGNKDGEAIITATTTDGNKVATCKVIVKKILVSEILFDNYLITASKGDACKFNATINPANATDKTIRWSYTNINSSINNPISIDEDGNIKIIAENGTVLVTAQSEDGNAKCEGYIEIKPVHELIKVEASVKELIGGNDHTTAKITSSISNPTSVSVEVMNVMLIEKPTIVKEIQSDLGILNKDQKVTNTFKEFYFDNSSFNNSLNEIMNYLKKYFIRYQVRIDGEVFNIETDVDVFGN